MGFNILHILTYTSSDDSGQYCQHPQREQFSRVFHTIENLNACKRILRVHSIVIKKSSDRKPKKNG